MHKVAVAFLIGLLCCMHIIPCYAEEVRYRYTTATLPNCKVSDYVAKQALIGLGGSLAGIITGAGMVKFGLMLMAVPLTIKVGSVMKGVGVGVIVGSTAVLLGAIGLQSAFFVCNWSFVRNPVLRMAPSASGGLGSVSSTTSYKTCKRPSGEDANIVAKYTSSDCEKEFVNMDDYFACLASNKSLEEARRLEPVCKDEKGFESSTVYAWPKNRVSSSDQIEVCYRLPFDPLKAVDVYSVATYGIAMERSAKSYADQLAERGYPREALYGHDAIKKMKILLGGEMKCATLRAGQEVTMHTATFRAVERGGNICVDAVKVSGLSLLPRPEIGCHMRPNSPLSPMCSKSKPIIAIVDGIQKLIRYDNSGCYSCYMDQSCQGMASRHSRSPFAVTSTVVSCVTESLKNVLVPPSACKNSKAGFLAVAQAKLKNAVMASLILALIFFAIKAILGGVQNASEIYMTGIKFALVLYFTQGDAMSHAYDNLVKLSVGLSDIVLSAGGNQSICNYKTSDYNAKFQYLIPWDRLDCRMQFYFGSQLNSGASTTIILATLLSGAMLIAAILINAKVIICLVALFAILMIIFIVIWSVYVFLLSLIALTVLILISPLMIPMCLFQVTKGFFDGWTKQLMTYALYPVILFTFLSLVFTVFDQLYFGDLVFRRDSSSTDGKIRFTLIDEKACDAPSRSDNLACILSGTKFHSQPLFLGLSVSTPEFSNTTGLIWTKLGVFVLVGFLFYHFLSSIAYIAGELAGDPRAGAIGSGSFNPKAMVGKATGAASAIRDKATGKVGELLERGKQRLNRAKGASGVDSVSGGSGEGGGGSSGGGSSSGGGGDHE